MVKKKRVVKDKNYFTFKSSHDIFRIVAYKISLLMGNVWVFTISFLMVIVWLFVGIFLNFSETWQLVINLTLSIITFLIVFIIQNSQTRDTKAIQLKLDELIRSHNLAHNTIIDLDSMSEKQIKELEKHYKKISSQHDDPLKKMDKSTPEE